MPQSRNNCFLFPGKTQWFLSGRSALQAIVKELASCRTIAMPSWCCSSMVRPFLDAGLDVRFYPVYFNGNLIQEIDQTCDVLFLMDYFGYTGQPQIINDFKGVVIRDVTHSVFSGTYTDADYYFGSLRKWCGVWTGGYAWTNDGHQLPREYDSDNGYVVLREKAMLLKNSYINDRGVQDKDYLNVFDEAEHCLEAAGIAPAAERDLFLIRNLDTECIRASRRENAEVLRQAFLDWLIFPEMDSNDCPMFVPVLVPDGRRSELREFLIKNDIYCPIHWPMCKDQRFDERTKQLYDNELSLVCDQRYTKNDMYRIVETITCFMESI